MSDEGAVEQSVLDMAGIGAEDAGSSEAPAETVETPTTDEAPAEAAEAPAEAEPETATPEAEAEADAPSASEDKRFNAMLAKANDEKAKRQAAVERAEAAEQKLAEAQAKPPPDPVADPEEFTAYVKDQIAQTKKEMGQTVEEMKYHLSREIIMSLNDDYADVETVFVEEAKQNPALQRQLRESANPALFAYEQGKRIQALSEDPATLRAKIEAEVRAELEAKVTAEKAEQQKTDEAVAGITPSLANAGNAGLETTGFDPMSEVKAATGEDARSRARK